MDAYNLSTGSGWTFGVWTSATSLQYAFSCNSSYSFRYGSNNVALSNVPVGNLSVDFNKNAYNMNGTTGTLTAQTFTCAYPMYLFAINAAGSVSSGKFTGRIRSCQIYDNGTLVRDFVPAKNSSGTAGLYDLANSTFYTNAGTGTFTAGSEYMSTARQFFGGGELKYYGVGTSLSVARHNPVGASVGNYALFAGGGTYTSRNVYYANVDAYSTSLTRTSAPDLSSTKVDFAGASVGNYALFGGGRAYTYYGTVDTYNASLTKGTTANGIQSCYWNAAASIGSYALFTNGISYTNVYAFNESLTRSNAPSLTYAKNQIEAASNDKDAIFAGGYNSTTAQSVYTEAYDSSLTKTVSTSGLTLGTTGQRSGHAAAGNGVYVVFAGGGGNMVDAFDTTLTKHTAATIQNANAIELAGTKLGDYALIGGGGTGVTFFPWVYAYDQSLVQTMPTNLSAGRQQLAATSVGDYAFFAGGITTGEARTDAVDIYTIA